MKTILKNLVLLLVLTISCMFLNAQTFDSSTNFRIKNKANGKCVGINEVLSFPQVILKDCAVTDYKFTIVKDPSLNIYTISGRNLADNSTYRLQYPALLNLINLKVEANIDPNSNLDRQTWMLTKYSDDSYNILIANSDNPLSWTSKILGLLEIPLINFVYLSSAANSDDNKWFLETISGTNLRLSDASTKTNSPVYPNPVRQGESITIDLSPSDNYELRIVDTDGIEVKYEKIRKDEKAVISTAGMRQGIYFYNAKGENNKISGKFSVN
ncbi:T9SS type A sorting domain-containing protein [Chryseobacterium sp. MMS23-Vi53]|uniref:T9SS type A sorting domain-containing protein n=1 Tax=Chryseobacterium sp. MMS23-Vi53 TaxID=3386644 RepID=UPI0039ECE6D2